MSRTTRIPTALAGAPNSQNANINSLIHPVVWAGTALTYSFPTDPNQYTGYSAGEEPFLGFEAAGAPYKAAVKFSFDSLSEFTNLTFSEIAPSTTNPATMRFGITADQAPTPGRPVQPDLAGWAFFPTDAAFGGDVWIRSNQNINAPFQPGAFRWSLVIHEIGHAMGLDHPFETGSIGGTVLMDPARDSTEYTIMAYRASTTVPARDRVGYAEINGEPQTWMQYDVAAFQYLYGANFNTRAGNTVYSWSPTTGQMFIDGVAYSEAPAINRILMNVWDGNGMDTYDFSNYTTNVISDLRPGEWSTPSASQLAITNTEATPTPARAPGSISNSLLFNGDLRSLIENATGGSGNDILRGNQANNTLIGNAGRDDLFGAEGDDVLVGGLGADALNGGTGTDTLRFDGATAGVTVQWLWGQGFGGDAEGDLYLDLENVVTTAFNDAVIGNAANNIIATGSGRDLVYAFDGEDQIFGEAGEDTLLGDNGNDSINGGSSSDFIIGGEGNDVLAGGEGLFRDYLYSNFGNDALYGESGDDIFDLRFDLKANDFDTLVDFQDFQNGAATNDYIALPEPFRNFAVIWNPGNGITQIAIPLAGGNYMVNVTGTSVANIVDNIIWV